MVNEVKSAGDGEASRSASQTGSHPTPSSGGIAMTMSARTPMRAGGTPIRELVSLYLDQYAGRDSSRLQRLAWWCQVVGDVPLQELCDDQVHAALEHLEGQSSRIYMGKDVDGKAIYKAKGGLLAPSTVNRYAAALGAVLTWAVKRRIAPKGFVHPCRTLERKTENNEKTRFLSASERTRLLEACRESKWPRL
jgi:hypothetical protein